MTIVHPTPFINYIQTYERRSPSPSPQNTTPSPHSSPHFSSRFSPCFSPCCSPVQPPKACPYNEQLHSPLLGEIHSIKGTPYFFPYDQFPHGHKDCLPENIELDPQRLDFAEKMRQLNFKALLKPSRGQYPLTMYAKGTDRHIFLIRCSSEGKLSFQPFTSAIFPTNMSQFSFPLEKHFRQMPHV